MEKLKKLEELLKEYFNTDKLQDYIMINKENLFEMVKKVIEEK